MNEREMDIALLEIQRKNEELYQKWLRQFLGSRAKRLEDATYTETEQRAEGESPTA